MRYPRFRPASRRSPLVLVALAALLAACGGSSGGGGSTPTDPSPTTGPLSGVVRNGGTNALLPGVTVTVGALTTSTDSNGAYRFADVPLGRRTVQATATGYADFTAQVTVVAAGTTQDITLDPATVFESNDAAMYIPPTVHTVRAVIVYMSSFDTRPVATGQTDTSETGLAMQTFRNEAGTLLSQYGVALVGTVDLRHIDDAAVEGAITGDLDGLAAASGHPEVATVPVIPIGMSGGSSPTYAYLARQAQRVLAFYTWIGPLQELRSTTADMRQVPGALILAERDSIVSNDIVRTWFDDNRALGALWSFGVEPNAIHNPPDSRVRAAMFQWLRDQLSLRLPGTSLTPLAENDGWLGNLTTLTIAAHAQYSGDPLTASWFPTQASAEAWQNLVAPVIQ